MHLLNTDLLSEMLSARGICVKHHRTGSLYECLKYKYLTPGEEEEPDTLYLCPCEEHMTLQSSAALYVGPWQEEELPDNTEYILCPETSERQLINHLEAVFTECREVEEKTRLAQVSASPLFDLCETASDFFHAECYLHDSHFFLRAYDRRVSLDGNPDFTYSPQYKLYMQSPEVLSELRFNTDYQKTFKTKGPQLWIDKMTDRRCIYINQFHYNQYSGRFIINLVEMTPGTASAVEYFGLAIQSIMYNDMRLGNTPNDPMSYLIRSYAEKETITGKMAERAASDAGWALSGQYICAIISFYKNQVNNYMMYGICDNIQQSIPQCRLYCRGNRIYMLINLKKGGLKPSDIRMKMSERIRESLLKAALSDTFTEMADFPLYMQQANACLDFMNETNRTDWFCEFRQIVVPLWLQKGSTALPEEALIAAGLRKLLQYDRENDASLYETLKVYIINERSPVETSKKLHIHRSSIPHRLDKITELLGYNLDSPITRLHLLMSFALLKEKENR